VRDPRAACDASSAAAAAFSAATKSLRASAARYSRKFTITGSVAGVACWAAAGAITAASPQPSHAAGLAAVEADVRAAGAVVVVMS
jgi:fructose-1,6-bisphosphatase/inositol monophosphatase family enzyme